MMSAVVVMTMTCSTMAYGAEVTAPQTTTEPPQTTTVTNQRPEATLVETTTDPTTTDPTTTDPTTTDPTTTDPTTTDPTTVQGKKLVPRELDAKAQPTLFPEPPKPEPPKVETPKAPEVPKGDGYDFDIASYTTKYTGAESINRNYNMRLASDSINGMILKPGQTFSYNDVILSKSDNGKKYKEAGVYVNGELSSGIGGGICQISSTLYQAALYSGMNITQRRNHSLRVGYMPAGRDATASWGTIDFKFKNPLKIPVKIESVMKNGTLKIRFLAQEDPKIGAIKVNVTQKDGVYTLTRTRADGTVDHTSNSKYKD